MANHGERENGKQNEELGIRLCNKRNRHTQFTCEGFEGLAGRKKIVIVKIYSVEEIVKYIRKSTGMGIFVGTDTSDQEIRSACCKARFWILIKVDSEIVMQKARMARDHLPIARMCSSETPGVEANKVGRARRLEWVLISLQFKPKREDRALSKSKTVAQQRRRTSLLLVPWQANRGKFLVKFSPAFALISRPHRIVYKIG